MIIPSFTFNEVSFVLSRTNDAIFPIPTASEKKWQRHSNFYEILLYVFFISSI
ncbi:MAG: hypothetical protein GX247_03025 [Mollicutes bacterium]|nr:hypothetical protein [Mollicutes bacterium]